MKKVILGLLIFASTNAMAQWLSGFSHKAEGTARGYDTVKTCERALNKALSNASNICMENGSSLDGYELMGGCGYVDSYLGYDKRIYEVAFNCK